MTQGSKFPYGSFPINVSEEARVSVDFLHGQKVTPVPPGDAYNFGKMKKFIDIFFRYDII